MGAFQQLTLADLILNREGTLTFRVILSIFGIALRLFFRRIETVNADVVPTGTGVIFVLNHPNGLIDPALVFVALPRKISFLATIFFNSREKSNTLEPNSTAYFLTYETLLCVSASLRFIVLTGTRDRGANDASAKGHAWVYAG